MMRSLLILSVAALTLAACQPAAEQTVAEPDAATTPTPAETEEAAVTAAAEAATAAPQACLADGERLEGRLSNGAAMHPNGEQMYSPFLILDAPRCVGWRGVSGTRVQLVPAQGFSFDYYDLDSRIAITADRYIEPEMDWQFGEIIALNARPAAEPET